MGDVPAPSTKWRAVLIAGGLAVVGVVVYTQLVAAKSHDQRDEAKELHRAWAEARIVELQREYDRTCSEVKLHSMMQLAVEADDKDTARFTAKPCTPARPTCNDEAKEAMARIEEAAHAEGTPAERCEGGLFRIAGKLERGFALLATWTGADGATHGVRDLASTDGDVDLVPPSAAPGAHQWLADLDGDGADELVTQTADAITVERTDGATLVAAGEPVALPAACGASLGVEPKPPGQVLTVTVSAGAKGCLASGRHVFALAGGKLVEQP